MQYVCSLQNDLITAQLVGKRDAESHTTELQSVVCICKIAFEGKENKNGCCKYKTWKMTRALKAEARISEEIE